MKTKHIMELTIGQLFRVCGEYKDTHIFILTGKQGVFADCEDNFGHVWKFYHNVQVEEMV